MISSRVSSWYALATVLLLSSRSLASWRIEGRVSPGLSTPAVTAALICSMSCSNCGSGLSMSMVISIGLPYVPVDPMVQLDHRGLQAGARGLWVDGLIERCGVAAEHRHAWKRHSGS